MCKNLCRILVMIISYYTNNKFILCALYFYAFKHILYMYSHICRSDVKSFGFDAQEYQENTDLKINNINIK